MESIPLPSKIEMSESTKDHARFIIEPCYPGYGTTIGNALRRVLLSSLQGAAVTAVKIEGVDHEFSTVPFVKEDAVSILLNVKLLRFKLHGDDPSTLRLSVKGEKVVTAADLEGPSTVEVANPKQVIATLTDKAGALNMEFIVQRGRGYVPIENREKEKLDIGWIAVDAIYTPIKIVSFAVENVRVGQITNFDRLILHVETDGTMRAEDAVAQAAKILVDHFTQYTSISAGESAETLKKKRGRTKKEEKVEPSEPQTKDEKGEATDATP